MQAQMDDLPMISLDLTPWFSGTGHKSDLVTQFVPVPLRWEKDKVEPMEYRTKRLKIARDIWYVYIYVCEGNMYVCVYICIYIYSCTYQSRTNRKHGKLHKTCRTMTDQWSFIIKTLDLIGKKTTWWYSLSVYVCIFML